VFEQALTIKPRNSVHSERAKDLMPSGQESLVIIIDYKTTTLRTNPSISVARKVGGAAMCSGVLFTLLQVLTILQQHYVETLGRAIVVNLPPLLNFFYKGISPFLDPVTRDKVGLHSTWVTSFLTLLVQMRFNPNLLELIPKEHLDADFGGDYEYEFEPITYWEQIVSWVHGSFTKPPITHGFTGNVA
jgi:hypothetical protein